LEVFFVRRPERKLLFEWGVLLTLADLGIQAIWQPKFNRLYWAAVQEAFEEKRELPRLECGATELVLNDRVIGSTSRGAWPAEVRFLPASVRRKKPVGKDPH
jgi:type II secretory pathway component PulM